MKKRKTPVLLLSALGGLVLVVVFINLAQMGLIAPQAPKDDHDHASVPEGTPATDKNIKDQMKANLSNVVGGTTTMAKPGEKAVAPEPTVAVPKPVTVKQKPNDSSTGTQWWSDESARANQD
ncbi:MAG: hypothetical protein K1X67_11905 [Fimbriimonadaceae bacterium]|nr:hypothetical protein [Fimbriimonadaceae bacterium]